MPFPPPRRRVSAIAAAAAILFAAPSLALGADTPDFVRDIRPLLDRSCGGCHSGEEAKSGLRLDIRAEAFRGGDGHGAAIVAGKGAESALVRFSRGDEPEMQMPPADANVPPLSPDEVSILAAWIDAGALWPEGIDRASLVDRRDHWAFQGVVRPAPPAVRDERWYFIRYKDGTEEFYDMLRDPMQWTNLATSKDPEVQTQMKRLAASFPATFAPEVPQNQGGRAEKQELAGKPDPTIRPARLAAQLK